MVAARCDAGVDRAHASRSGQSSRRPASPTSSTRRRSANPVSSAIVYNAASTTAHRFSCVDLAVDCRPHLCARRDWIRPRPHPRIHRGHDRRRRRVGQLRGRFPADLGIGDGHSSAIPVRVCRFIRHLADVDLSGILGQRRSRAGTQYDCARGVGVAGLARCAVPVRGSVRRIGEIVEAAPARRPLIA